MKTAMILTGGLRTFEKTADSLFKHIIEPNNCTLFVVCENDVDPTELIQSKFPGIEIGGMLWAPSFRNDSEGFNGIANDILNIKPALVNTTVVAEPDTTVVAEPDTTVVAEPDTTVVAEPDTTVVAEPDTTVVAEPDILKPDRPGLTDEVFARAGWDPVVGREWLRNGSGSLIQWYQLWLSWFLVRGYEMRNGAKFDICVKSRFDLLFTETLPLTDFFSREWGTEEEMRSLGNARMRSNPTDISNGYADEVGTAMGTFDTTVWTFGIELAIIAKRDTFEPLVSTIFNYGNWDSGLTSSFNSETTFHQYCKSLGLVHWAYQDIGFPLYSTDINSTWTFVILR